MADDEANDRLKPGRWDEHSFRCGFCILKRGVVYDSRVLVVLSVSGFSASGRVAGETPTASLHPNPSPTEAPETRKTRKP